MAVHSLSKRSNLAGRPGRLLRRRRRAGPYLSEVRKHAGFMVPGPVQAAAVAAWATTPTSTSSATATAAPRAAGRILATADAGLDAAAARRRLLPLGARRPTATPGHWPDGWPPTRGLLASPGEFYGEAGAGHVRLALVQPDDRIELVGRRLASARASG